MLINKYRVWKTDKTRIDSEIYITGSTDDSVQWWLIPNADTVEQGYVKLHWVNLGSVSICYQ